MSDLSAIEPYVSAAADAFLGGGIGFGVQTLLPRRVWKTNKDEDLGRDKNAQRKEKPERKWSLF